MSWVTRSPTTNETIVAAGRAPLELRIGARAATVGEARLLRERKGAPLLTMERTAYDDSGRAVEFGSHAYRAQTYSFEVTLVER